MERVATVSWDKCETGSVVVAGAPAKFIEAEYSIPVPLDRKRPSSGVFNLYFFRRVPKKSQGTLKNVLFCAGGPGELPLDDSGNNYLDTLVDGPTSDIAITYFHQRGSGFSQVSHDNAYDRYLRAHYVIDDLETIRSCLGIKGRWDTVFGYSYGALIAHRYAYMKPEAINNVILSAPPSRHMFAEGIDYTRFMQARHTLMLTSLRKIYDIHPIFRGLQKKDHIIARVSLALDAVKRKFGRLTFLIDHYDAIQKRPDNVKALKDGRGELFRIEFFRALSGLKQFGWLPYPKAGRSVSIGVVLAAEVLGNLPVKRMLETYRRGSRIDDSRKQFHRNDHGRRNRSKRTHYVYGAYDGFHSVVLKELPGADSPGATNAAIAQLAIKNSVNHTFNKQTAKVGPPAPKEPQLKPWDPALYPHGRPTLVLKGGVDPVTADQQAERYLESALLGPKLLIEFPGVGHDLKRLEQGAERRMRRLLQDFIRNGNEAWFGKGRAAVEDSVRAFYDDAKARIREMDESESLEPKILPKL